MSWLERPDGRTVLDPSPLTAAALGVPAEQLTHPLAATVALQAAGRHLDQQVLAGASVLELDGTLAVMRGIHMHAVGALAAAAGRATARTRVAARRRSSAGAISSAA